MTQAWPIIWLETIDSTNEEAKRRAASGHTGPMWIAARNQTAGRGRRGRAWISPEGSLYATALFDWDGEVRDLTRIPFAAALAVADAAMRLAPDATVKLKWPNDVRVDGAKLSGILVETGEADGRRWVATGIGINVGVAPDDVGQDTTSVAALRGDDLITTDITLDALAEAFATRLAQAKTDFSTILAAWVQHADGLGEAVRIHLDDTEVRGVFDGLADDGALKLQLPDGSQRLIRAGDVELIREMKA